MPAAQGPPSAMYKYLQDDSGQSTLKKVKCQRACKFCRKSHTTCEDTRPCQRCIKRDIAQLCLQDEADQLAQQAAQQQQQQMAAAAAAGNANGSRPTIPAKRRGYSGSEGERPPDRRPSLVGAGSSDAAQFLDSASAASGAGPSGTGNNSGSMHTPSPSQQAPGTDVVGNVQLPNIMQSQSPQDTFRQSGLPSFDENMNTSPLTTTSSLPQWYDSAFAQPSDAAPGQGQVPPPPPPQIQTAPTPEGFSWSALVDGLMDPMHSQSPGNDFAWLSAHTANTPNGRTLGAANLSSGGVTSASPSGTTGLGKGESPMSPDIASDTPAMPYNYTFGYSRLRTWANSMVEPVKSRVNSATDKFKPILHSCLSQYSEEQIIGVDVQFWAYVRTWSAFCDTIPAPACIWRRTGEIYAANKRMLELIDMTPQTFRPGKLSLYNTLDPVSFTEYWEAYGGQVLHHLSDRSNFDVVLPVALSNRPGDKTHLLMSNMVFDTIGLPLVATAVLSPLHPPSRTPAEPSIDVQVGGTELNPVIRPISLSSLRYLWMV